MIFPLEPKLDARIRSYVLSCRAKAAGRIDAREDQIRPTRPAALQASHIARQPKIAPTARRAQSGSRAASVPW